MQINIYQQVAAHLVVNGLKARFEHVPDRVTIEHNGLTWEVGDANGGWGGDLMSASGESVGHFAIPENVKESRDIATHVIACIKMFGSGEKPSESQAEKENPRFVWNIGAIVEQYPDMPEQREHTMLWDRQEKKPVVTVHSAYAQAFVFELTALGHSPFSDMEKWFNSLDNATLESENLTPSKPKYTVTEFDPTEPIRKAKILLDAQVRRTQSILVIEALALLETVSPDSNLAAQYSETHSVFQGHIARLATKWEMPVLEVYKLWRKYAEVASAGDQSAVISELEAAEDARRVANSEKFVFQPDKDVYGTGASNNGAQADRAALIIQKWINTGLSIQDIISDIGHFCDREGIDFNVAIKSGVDRWTEER